MEKGDHIRLQDVNLMYTFPSGFVQKSGMKSVSMYLHMRNLGILWKRTGLALDPDYHNVPYAPPTVYTMGIHIKL